MYPIKRSVVGVILIAILIGGAGAYEQLRSKDRTDAVIRMVASSTCDYESEKRILIRQKNGYTAEWTLDDDVALRKPFNTADSAYRALVDWIHRHTNLSSLDLLRRNLVNWSRFRDSMYPKDPGRIDAQRSIDRLRMIVAGKVGVIRPIRCLEGIPYREFLRVNDLRRFPQEFGAYYFKKNGRLKIVGDFYHLGGIGNEPTGTDESKTASLRRVELVKQGWQLSAHLHNHTFVFGNSTPDIGGNLIPSGPDLELYDDTRVPKALISNGLETIELLEVEIELLKNSDRFAAERSTGAE